MYAHFMKNRHFYLQRPKFWPIYLLVAGCGGGGGGSGEPISNPIAQNQSPTLTVDLANRLPENRIRIGEVVASDPDGDDVSIELTGEDTVFIDLRQELLVFKTAPDYEDAVDSDSDNVFVFDLTASDGTLSVSRSLEIEVFNVSEGKYDEAKYENDSLE